VNIVVMGLMMGLMILFFHGRGHHRPEPKPLPAPVPSMEDRPALARESQASSGLEASRTQSDRAPVPDSAPLASPANPKGE
jgi:hypothetical protein